MDDVAVAKIDRDDLLIDDCFFQEGDRLFGQLGLHPGDIKADAELVADHYRRRRYLAAGDRSQRTEGVVEGSDVDGVELDSLLRKKLFR